MYICRLVVLLCDDREQMHCRCYFVGCLIYSILKTKRSGLLYNNLAFRSNIATRVPDDLPVLPMCRTEMFKGSFCSYVVEMWNNLPPRDREIQTVAHFREQLFTLLL